MMNKHRLIRIVTTLLSLVLLCGLAAGLRRLSSGEAALPGLREKKRRLLRVWAVNAPGGGMSWLKKQLHAFEKQYPGVSTYLRQVQTKELQEPDAVLPDLLLFMPGDVSNPEAVLLPVTGEAATQKDGLIREELLRCGRWKGKQYGLPLCWGGWVLAIDSAYEPGTASTPAPTTLLGKANLQENEAATPEPDFPMEAVLQADCPLQAPGGAALFSLGMLLEDSVELQENAALLQPEKVYAAFQRRECAAAILTTGQATAFSALVSGGGGFPFRVMTPDKIITDQVWLAGIPDGASGDAALLAGFLTGTEAQRMLSAQSLHTVRQDLSLYAAGTEWQIEQAARRALTAINAFTPAEMVRNAAWQYYQGRCDLTEALMPLL